jgi:two-component system chemotaxis sensor kinase CheA
MEKKEEEFLKRLKSLFKIEAEEHLNLISSSLIELEKKPKPERSTELVEIIYRETHSLKGAARSVDKNDIVSICQVLENIFSELKDKKILLIAEQYDLIHKAINIITIMVPGSETTYSRELIKQLQAVAESKKSPEKRGEKSPAGKVFNKKKEQDAIAANNLPVRDSTVEEASFHLETIRIPTTKLDPLFLQAEQMIQSKVAFAQRTIDIKSIHDFIGLWKTESRKLDIHYSSRNGSQVKEIIDWNNQRLNKLEGDVDTLSFNIESDQRLLGKMIDEHLESMKEILMHPVSVIIEGFPKLVRDLAQSQDKKVELVINEKEIEVDKRILQELKGPLIHLIRNCIDHGIKKPEERVKNGSPPQGTITLSFMTTDGRNLEITISDDGSGINMDEVISSAVKVGVISRDNVENMSTQETLALIFKSGVSTSQIITDISGRGLGLAIVKEKVKKLGGTISINSKPNIGTTFRILVPLTLYTFRGVLVRTGEHYFFIPAINVKLTARINSEGIKTVKNRETINLNQEIIAIVKLSDVLGLNDKPDIKNLSECGEVSGSNFIQIIVLKQGDRQIGFKVNEILDEHQILVKELGKQLKYVRNISGATILGSGTVVPVINVSDLLESAVLIRKPEKYKVEEKAPEKIYKILVAEDSITSRALIKDILETAGYIVETAVDGIDGHTKALVGEFDLIVSDIDMPRMNGFELTTKIRNNKKLSDLPVVLVTALESRDDREHGIDVGANAYIIKSSFDQSNLLDVIKKLL